ncbi:PREDICTED: signal recognition particle 54 kDa protein 2-like [Camelina sativa]|uniref:Signal recognition particle 54 kDa protein 2-like n=1 Tax=Camelina sativa TaxID=90675 RepID=A0ABM0W265_CAMSA|nr:PREDICTED: signal recognition particle 54 kDa protein 2-like [Camelina sativa]
MLAITGKKGFNFRPALVCAADDTFKINAFNRLKKAAEDEVLVYGSITSDPAQGIEKFKKAKRDLITVDTSVRHKRCAN